MSLGSIALTVTSITIRVEANEVYGQKRAKREKWECRVQVAYQAMLARIEPFFLAEFDRMLQFSSLILSYLVEATATVLFFVI